MDPFIAGKRDILLYLIHVLLAWDLKSASIVRLNQNCLRSCLWFFYLLNFTGVLLFVEYPLLIIYFHRFISDCPVLSVRHIYLLSLLLYGNLRDYGLFTFMSLGFLFT